MNAAPSRLLSLPLLPLLALGAELSAQVNLSIEPDKDNTLYENQLGGLSNGAGTRMFCGATFQGAGASLRRAMIRFDVAGNLPPCSTIQSVSLTVTVMRSISGDTPCDLHRVLQDWGEAGSVAGGQQGAGGAVQNGDATWLHTFYPAQTWTNQGGDFDATVSGTQNLGASGASYTFASTPQMVADVQAWLDAPAANYGWMLRGLESTPGSAKAMATREHPVAGSRPSLSITYLPPNASTTPFGAGCSGTGGSPLTLSANGNPTIPNPGFVMSMTGGPAGPASAFAFALGRSPFPIPIGGGCFVHLDPFTVFTFVSGDANRNLPLGIPNDLSFLGAKLDVQGVVIDGATSLPVTSNGLELKLGL